MPKLKVIKRDAATINNPVDYNPSVFRYFVENQEVQFTKVRDGLKSAFLGMLDALILNDDSLFDELSDWTINTVIPSTLVVGGSVVTVNTYTGIKYIYRIAITTTVAPAIPATLGTYTGLTYWYQVTGMMTTSYVLQPDLNKATHGVKNGIYKQFIEFGGTQPVQAVTSFQNQGYYPIQGAEIGTHGKNGSVYEPLAYWNTSTSNALSGEPEFTGILTEARTGYKLNSKNIGLALTETGEALKRYNPIDLITFASLIKLQYNSRMDMTVEDQI